MGITLQLAFFTQKSVSTYTNSFLECSMVKTLRLLSFSKIANEVVINILGQLPRRQACVLLEWLPRSRAAESQMVRVFNEIGPTCVYQLATL